MTEEELLIRKRIMLLSMQKDKSIPVDQLEVIREELKDTNLEIEMLHSTPKTTRSVKKSFMDELGLIEQGGIHNSPIFLEPSNIKQKKRDVSKIIKSRIIAMDKRIIGFNPGEISIWSGSNGSGKSSILSQLALECIDQNFRCALFSGELDASRVMDWIALQSAGRQHTESTQFENYYRVPDGIKTKIDKWLDGKLFIYNNDYGNNALSVLKATKECIATNNINMVIIDNLMALDVIGVDGEKYDRQSSLVKAMCALAKKYSVHIHFVAHPRKAISFLRKTDISGTADLTNAADNVFIVHRVGTDFKKATQQDLGLKSDSPIYCYSNVIEICKNRDLGVQDIFVGTYFEKESKRFLNTVGEQKHYGWEVDKKGFVKMTDKEKLPFDD